MYELQYLIVLSETTQTERDGNWIPARPLVCCFWHRLKDAWAVLWGKADAVKWPGGQ